jgi:hypothetical protein
VEHRRQRKYRVIAIAGRVDAAPLPGSRYVSPTLAENRMIKPNDGETVWIEYPEGRRFRATYRSASDTFAAADRKAISACEVANWSRGEHEDYDISDDPTRSLGGELTRDQ